MNKHAYLIMTHNNFYILEKLLLLLDSEKHDIFVHVDKKVLDFPFEKFEKLLKKSKLIFIPRMDIIWASPTQITCEIELLKTSMSYGKYSYYHLLSGVDLPIKSQDEIYNFFENNKGKEFIGFTNQFDKNRVCKINLFNNIGRGKSFINSIKYRARKLFIIIQNIFNYNYMNKYKMSVKKGTNWFSITDELARYVVKNEKLIKDMFKYSISGDEHFLHTLVWNSSFKDNVYNLQDELDSCKRLIDWNRGQPYTYKEQDYDLIINSDKLFARKFDMSVDSKIVDMIYDTLK